MPAGQSAQAWKPRASAYRPAAQAAQVAAPLAEVVPRPQAEHTDALAPEYCPAAQLTQAQESAAPTVAEAVPAAQPLQVAAPVLTW